MKESRMSGGRIAVYCPDHPKANNMGYVLRARHVMEQRLGRMLSEQEEVHHKNGDKTDDRLENLEILSCGEHARRHILDGKSGFGQRKLNYARIAEHMETGLGYKRIAKLIGAPQSSVKCAMRVLRKSPKH